MKKRVLVIEDEKEISLILKKRLEAAGYDVLQAFDGADGLIQARTSEPDLVLLDLVLPEVSGAQILDELKRDHRPNKIPVVIVTCLARELESVKISAAKAEACFLKPFDTTELMATVARLLNDLPKA
jgi:DNA-binding response OmpR family regulator